MNSEKGVGLSPAADCHGAGANAEFEEIPCQNRFGQCGIHQASREMRLQAIENIGPPLYEEMLNVLRDRDVKHHRKEIDRRIIEMVVSLEQTKTV